MGWSATRPRLTRNEACTTSGSLHAINCPHAVERLRLATVAALCGMFVTGALVTWVVTRSRPEVYDTTITVNTSGKIVGEITDQYIEFSHIHPSVRSYIT